MGLFRKDKKSEHDLKPLSENEIQKKLYGEFKPRRGHEAFRPKSEPQFISKPSVKKENISSASGGDLFALPSDHVKHDDVSQKQSAPSQKDLKREKERFEKLAQIAEREEKARKQKKAAGTVFTARAVSVGRKFWQTLLKAGQALLTAALGLISAVLKVFVWMLQWFDVRKTGVRRVFYWLSSILVLALLFAGIHFLNVRREAAMNAQAVPQARTEMKTSANPGVSTPAVAQNQVPEETDEAVVAGEPDVAPLAETKNAEPEVILPAASSDKPYVIQIATYVNAADAQQVVSQFHDAGIKNAFEKQITRPSGKIYYSVFIGRYTDFKTAQRAYDEFKKNKTSGPFQDAFIRLLST